MMARNLFLAVWFLVWPGSYAASEQCSGASSRLLFEELAHKEGIGREAFALATPESFEFRSEGFPTVGAEGAKIFRMGDDFGERREVKLTRPFEIQATQATQFQYALAMGENPSRFSGNSGEVLRIGEREVRIMPNHPVERVSWWNAQRFIQKLNELQSDYTYAFPTEAEWEFAARGGSDTWYWFGDDVEQLELYGWFKKNSGGQTHAVASLPPNPFGLYDMNGNVWEWTQDWHGKLAGRDKGRVTDPEGAEIGISHVVRGGAWYSSPWALRSANRLVDIPDYRFGGIGLRLIRRPRSK